MWSLPFSFVRSAIVEVSCACTACLKSLSISARWRSNPLGYINGFPTSVFSVRRAPPQSGLPLARTADHLEENSICRN
jgi:hypothetical protein